MYVIYYHREELLHDLPGPHLPGRLCIYREASILFYSPESREYKRTLADGVLIQYSYCSCMSTA